MYIPIKESGLNSGLWSSHVRELIGKQLGGVKVTGCGWSLAVVAHGGVGFGEVRTIGLKIKGKANERHYWAPRT